MIFGKTAPGRGPDGPGRPWGGSPGASRAPGPPWPWGPMGRRPPHWGHTGPYGTPQASRDPYPYPPREAPGTPGGPQEGLGSLTASRPISRFLIVFNVQRNPKIYHPDFAEILRFLQKFLHNSPHINDLGLSRASGALTFDGGGPRNGPGVIPSRPGSGLHFKKSPPPSPCATFLSRLRTFRGVRPRFSADLANGGSK